MPDVIKICLISVYVFENNGVRFLSATLRNAGHKVTEFYFKDYVHHHFVPPSDAEKSLLLDAVAKQAPDLIGVSVRAGAYLPVAAEITQKLKERLGVPIMWGGPHVSMAPEQCIDHPDFMLVGEADEAVHNVVDAIAEGRPVDELDNVWLKKDGRIIKNPLRPLCQDLDSIPFRDYHSHDDKYWIDGGKIRQGDPMVNETLYLMITSRGCLYNCSFCDVSSFRRLYEGNGKFFRYRSVDNCLDEIDYARGVFKRLKRIRFDDELFVPDKKWIGEFADKYPKRVGLPFEILSDPRCLDEWTIEKLAKAGLDKVMIGIQGAEQVNRRLYNRPAPDQRVIDLAAAFKRHKVTGVFQVIVDDPEVTTKDKRELLELLLNMERPYDLYMFSLCHWPAAARTLDMIGRDVICEDDVEGRSNKVLTQFMADFAFDRPAEDTFFIALNQLANKTVIPRALVRRWSKSERLMSNPWPVVLLAKITNLAKLGFTGLGMLLRGEMSWNVIKRWIHIFDSPST